MIVRRNGRKCVLSHLVLMGHPDEPFLCPLGLRSRVIELISLDGQEPQLRIITITSWFSHFLLYHTPLGTDSSNALFCTARLTTPLHF